MIHGDLITGVAIEESQSLTFEEFCQATNVSKEFIFEMIDYKLVQPQGNSPSEWRFDSLSLRRGRIAASFYHELEIPTMQGVALAVELLEEIEQLRQQIELLKKFPHF
jgi:chaperone modulatory protein CbpM